MRTRILLLSVAAVLALGACKKKDDNNSTGGPTGYLLKKTTTTYQDAGSTVVAQQYLYTYNSAHLVARIDMYNMSFLDTEITTFTYASGLCTAINSYLGGSTAGTPITTTIAYDAQGRPDKSTRHLSQDDWVHHYTYDSQNRWTGGTDSSQGFSGTTSIAYSGNGTEAISITTTETNVVGYNANKTEWTFTTNGDINYLNAIPGLPREVVTFNNGTLYTGLYVHNIASQASYSASQTGEPLTLQGTTTYSYTYNEGGLPTHIVVTSGGSTSDMVLEYDKY